MEFLADTWFLWLVLCVAVTVLVNFLREGRRGLPEQEHFSSESEFSVTNLLFGLKSGQGDMFISYSLSTLFFVMFLLGFLRWLRTIF